MGKRTAVSKDAEERTDADLEMRSVETSAAGIEEEPVARHSGTILDKRDNNMRGTSGLGAMESLVTPVRTMTQRNSSRMDDDTMETPVDYISLSDESGQELNTSDRKRRSRMNTRSTSAKTGTKTKKILYADSEDDMLEGAGVDTLPLITLNEMSANEVAVKTFVYAKIIEDIRTRSGTDVRNGPKRGCSSVQASAS